MTCTPEDHIGQDTLTIEHLGAAELFCVTCLRLWVEECLETKECGCDWRDGFAQAGIPQASIDSFDTFMTIISKTAQRSIDVRRARCHCMSQDEARFLGMIASVQTGSFPMFQNLLSDWVPVTAIRAATMPIAMVAGALDACGLRLATEEKPKPSARIQPGLAGQIDQGSHQIH